MVVVRGKRGVWELEQGHEWTERRNPFKHEAVPWISVSSNVFVLGACVAVSIAAGLRRLKFAVSTHPDGHLYHTRSMRQVLERIGGGWQSRDEEPIWRMPSGFMDPFAKSYREVLPTEAEVLARRSRRDADARDHLAKADVVLILVESTELWRSARTGNSLVMLPLPEVFPTLELDLVTLTVNEMKEDLRRIITLAKAHSRGAKVVLGSSATWLHLTATAKDVRDASFDSIARIQAAIGEICTEFANGGVVHYPLAAMIHAFERRDLLMLEDGRHLANATVDWITSEFLRQFGDDSVRVPAVDIRGALGVAATRPHGAPTSAPRPSWAGRVSAAFKCRILARLTGALTPKRSE